jgi:tripartite-type tricarboxylate transporter receptor subunit TctC
MNPFLLRQRRSLITCALGSAAMALTTSSARAQAQSYPTRPLRLVVPFPAGGPTDIVARPLAQMLSQALGQQVLVDNRGGAGGSIGAEVVAKAAADGYTLFIGTVGTHAINPSLYRKLPYDAEKDFTPLGLVAMAPVAVVVNASAPYANVADLIAAAKREPGLINFASAGNGTPGHLTGEMFAKAAGIDLKHIPYKGSAPAITDLLGGQIPLMFDPVQSVLQHVRSGKLKALAISSQARSHVLPNAPTLSAAGLKGFEATAWWAIFAPAGLPPALSEKLSQEIFRITQAEAFRSKLMDVGVQVLAPSSNPALPAGAASVGAGFVEFQRSEMLKWGRAVRDSGVTLD